jgi:hypothetical protein
MPFKSEAQRRYLWKFHPDIAKAWANKYGSKAIRKAAISALKAQNGPTGSSKK